MKTVIFILAISFLVNYSYVYEDISQDDVKILFDFTDNFLTSYRSYVSFDIPIEEIQNYKNEKGDYIFFPFKHETLDIRIYYTSGDLIAFLLIPSEKNNIEIINYRGSELNLFGISRDVNQTFGKDCSNLIETESVAYKTPCVYLFSKSKMKNPSYAREVAFEYFNWENQTVHKTIETKKINVIWEPFKKENKQVIENIRNLYWTADGIDDNIIFKDDYTYDLFLIDFYKFNISVTHYKDLPIMADKWNEFVNSNIVKNFCVVCYPEIDSNFGLVKNNMESNESYTLANLNEDLPRLNNSINSMQTELQNKSIKSKFSNFFNQFWTYFVVAIVVIAAFLSNFLGLRQFIKERNQIKNEIINLLKVLYAGLNKSIKLILSQIKPLIQRQKKVEKH